MANQISGETVYSKTYGSNCCCCWRGQFAVAASACCCCCFWSCGLLPQLRAGTFEIYSICLAAKRYYCCCCRRLIYSLERITTHTHTHTHTHTLSLRVCLAFVSKSQRIVSANFNFFRSVANEQRTIEV